MNEGNAKKNLRVAVCGIDGSGKSTLIKNLISRLCMRGFKTATARVPFFTKDIFREVQLDGDDLSREQELIKRAGMAFDFARYYRSLDFSEGILICDRYDIDFEVLHDVYELSDDSKATLRSLYKQTPEIDLYIFLRIDYRIAAERLNARGNRKTNENDIILKKMQESFESHFGEIENVVYIEATKSELEILDEAYTVIVGLWENKK